MANTSKRTPKKALSEHQIQAQIVKYLRMKGFLTICTDVMAALGYITGNKRFAFIRHYKDIGYTKGQPDLIAIKENRIYIFEVKSEKGRLSSEQKVFIETLNENGIDVHVVKSLDEVMEII